MGASIKDMLANFRRQNTLIQLIGINAAIFLVLTVVKIIGLLFDLYIPDLIQYIGVSSDLGILVRRIWTLITYMFVHYDIWHVLMNMLMLYWFGRIFLMYFTPKNMTALYVLGGLAGAVFYILTFNTIPYFVKQGDSYMVGASASVMAIIFASAFYNKNLELNLFFVLRVKIIYIAWALFVF
ncbi:MAG TPA: rhomboid family intramembrane serine protease, partial [Dysgonomonas sp.]|nr:rhomboid family intramembrane serine protease [Dysgonomonas sp.]